MAKRRKSTTDAVEILRRRYGKDIMVRKYQGRSLVLQVSGPPSIVWSRINRKIIDSWREAGYRVRIDMPPVMKGK